MVTQMKQMVENYTWYRDREEMNSSRAEPVTSRSIANASAGEPCHCWHALALKGEEDVQMDASSEHDSAGKGCWYPTLRTVGQQDEATRHNLAAALVHTECPDQTSSDLNHHQMTAELEQCYKPKTSSL